MSKPSPRSGGFQFFIEGDVVASMESFRSGWLSPISITAVEPSTRVVLSRVGFFASHALIARWCVAREKEGTRKIWQ